MEYGSFNCLGESCCNNLCCLTTGRVEAPSDIITLLDRRGIHGAKPEIIRQLSLSQALSRTLSTKYLPIFIAKSKDDSVALYGLQVPSDEKFCSEYQNSSCSIYPQRPYSCKISPITFEHISNSYEPYWNPKFCERAEGEVGGKAKDSYRTLRKHFRLNRIMFHYLDLAIKKDNLKSCCYVHPQTRDLFGLVTILTSLDDFFNGGSRDDIKKIKYHTVVDVDDEERNFRTTKVTLTKFNVGQETVSEIIRSSGQEHIDIFRLPTLSTKGIRQLMEEGSSEQILSKRVNLSEY